ncbi:plantacyanin [Hibiscus trionum]|uniref:Plantacyanin n=1 Tax=Hibiscus trionum TaxID=183268 RepID=A0A9W7I5L7_HIBTR|nr:plantacyanin [Hibiscus trionum]
MAQGRCSAMAATTVLLYLLLSLHFESAQSATFTVEGSGGWTFNAAGWTKGKRFRAGDTLADIPTAFVPDVTPNTSSIPTESIPTDIVSTDIPHTSSQTTTSIPGSSASVDPDNSASIPGAKVFRSGKDQIKLRKGQNFFICNYIGHCQAGMKIAVIAA